MVHGGWRRLLRRRVRWFSSAAVPMAFAVGLAACGSTADAGSAAAFRPAPGHASTQLADGLTAPGPRAAADAPSAPPWSSGAVAPVASAPGAGNAPLPSVETRAAAPDRITLMDGPGVTASTITFGVTFANDTGQANAAIGAGAIDPGDTRRYYNALVEDVNRTGGIAGRKLVPAYYETSTTASASAESQRQAACEHFTSDVKAFVLFDASSELMRSCAEKRGLLSTSGGGNAVIRTFTRYPHYFEPSGVALENYELATMAGLGKTDYFGKAPVIGIVTWDDPSFRTAVVDGALPGLARLGLKPAVIEYVNVPQSYPEAGGFSAALSSAILAFKQRGVTHVFLVDGPSGVCLGGCLTVFWIKQAATQSYYPRYGFNDLNAAPAWMAEGVISPDDVRGARAVTLANYDESTEVGVPRNASRVACLALMKRHGMTPSGLSMLGAMLHACDNVWFLRAVLGTDRAVVNRDRFVAVADKLGTRYRSPMTYRTEITSSHHDGVAGYRRQAMDDSCDCFVYTSGIYPR